MKSNNLQVFYLSTLTHKEMSMKSISLIHLSLRNDISTDSDMINRHQIVAQCK